MRPFQRCDEAIYTNTLGALGALTRELQPMVSVGQCLTEPSSDTHDPL